MQTMLSVAAPAVLYLAGLFGFAYPLVRLQKRKQKGENSPLTGGLLHSPGTSLQNRIDDLGLDITTYIAALPALPLLIYSLSLPWAQTQKITAVSVLILAGILLLLLIWIVFKISRLSTERNACRLSLDAEASLGQELNQLMFNGFRVFHGFPADDFNIDHVAVGPTGVYAVETKERTRAVSKKGKVDAAVIYDGDTLQFPSWYETESLLQAQHQAEWLGEWLSNAVGSSVYVQAVLALPEWYVVRNVDRPVKVISGKEASSLAKSSGVDLNDDMIQKIAQQLEQRCRDMEPVAYRQEPKES